MKNTLLIMVLGVSLGVSCSKKEEAPSDKEQPASATAEQVVSPTLSPVEEGKTLVEGADCLTCHKTDAKLIGPSYQEVAAKYTEADVDLLADKIVNGGSGVWGDVPMAAHPGLDKENAKKMVKYILSLKK